MANNSQVLLEELVNQEKENLEEPISLSRFFELYSASQILKGYELSHDEIEAGLTGEGLDGGADAIYLFVNGELVKEDENIKEKYKKNVDIEVFIIQSKFSNSFEEDPLLRLSRLSKNLFDLEFERGEFEGRYTDKVLGAFDLFRTTYKGLITKKPKLSIKYFYASKGSEVHPNVQKQAEDLKGEVCQLLSEASAEVTFVGADELIKLANERPNDTYTLKLSENPLSSTGKVFIVLVNLSDYFNFITDDNNNLIKHIFESNVRDYQGNTNVNNEIQETLENIGAEEFWWLNNGVTIIASDSSAPGGKELIIHNPEIVNGLQTSEEIFRNYSNNSQALEKETRSLLIRVIVPDSEETRDRIIRATNSQTPIPKASLRATDQVHRQIEDYMKARGLYYDRRKNYYKNEGKKPREIVSVPFLAQCLMSALMQKPDSARGRPSTLLDDDDAYQRLYHKNNNLNTYYFLASLGRTIELKLKESQSFTSSEINDIRFYVLYAVCVEIFSNLYPGAKLFEGQDPLLVDQTLMQKSIELVYDLYKGLGGHDKVAKGPKLLEALKEKLREKVDLKKN